ncbi:MAG TPA: sensor histidine kinase [Burkholderiales bacterium]|jgi:two-component system sensor histidine kinase TctE|nr:sensor histidine kinase [Burkholderiales bacterium]
MPAATRTLSIRRALLARLMGPLVLIMILGGACAYGLAQYFSQTVLDQWLYDSAISLANRVKWDNGAASVDLPEGAREILEWDVVDRIFYEVISERGERLIGNAVLPPPPALPAANRPVYYEGRVNGAFVRILAVGLQGPQKNLVLVKVAETRLKRDALASQVLWISVALSILLAAVSAAVIWYGIGAGMASMERAVREVRSVHAEAPLSPIAIDGSLPQEVFPLVQEINDLIETLSAAHHLNQRFIADAAHQLRTPLATLRVQLELALREQDAVRHETAINDAVHALTRMGHTLHQLLTLAKADRDQSGVAPLSLVDIDLIAREEVERRIDDADAGGVDLGYAGAGAPVRIRGQEELLREAVSNLLDNALRYGAAGRHVTVGVSATPPEIYVEDTGPGIPESEREKVRQRFYRMPGTQGDGCGLGLSIVEEIVRRHAASLVLENRSDAGGLRARFIFQGGPLAEPAAA